MLKGLHEFPGTLIKMADTESAFPEWAWQSACLSFQLMPELLVSALRQLQPCGGYKEIHSRKMSTGL